MRALKKIEEGMQRKSKIALALLFSAGTLVRAQSLGDAARAQRDKESAAPKATVVVTTDDLESDSKASVTVPPGSVKSVKSQHQKPAARPASETVDPRVAAAWKQKVAEQKEKVQTLQAQIDQLDASINPPGGAQFNGPPSRDRAKLMQRRAETQLQLDSQKRKLAGMQEQARQAGMHTATYDP
jgi:hypothetical protein